MAIKYSQNLLKARERLIYCFTDYQHFVGYLMSKYILDYEKHFFVCKYCINTFLTITGLAIQPTARRNSYFPNGICA